MRFSYCIWALAALLVAPATAQTPQSPAPTRSYVIFLRGAAIGREDVTLASNAAGTTITSQGRIAVPVETVLQRVEIRYNPQGSPESLAVDGVVGGVSSALRTSIKNGSATTTTVLQGKTTSTTQAISSSALVLPNGVFAGFAALAQRLSPSTPEGTEFRFFLVPNAEIAGKLSAIKNEQMQTGPTLFDVRRYELTLGDAGASTVLSLTTATDGSLLRITLPAQSVDVLREDIAGANTRTTVYTNPGDQRASIPALGFNLAATITFPSGASTVVERKEVAKPTVVPVGPASRTGSGIRTASPEAPPPEPDPVKRPGVVLVAGKASPDRDTITAGVPAMSHLAGALAEAGFVVVRYDNRGVGQSGGRTEAATLTDYAGDLRGVVKWMADRKDVDDRRIAVVGYGDGGWMAMSAAASDKRIAAVVSLAAPASKGVDVVLDQQRAELQALAMSDSERKAKEALQKQIHAAVLSGKGWDQIPPELRRRADTPWFHSLLAYDPGKVIDDIRAPILIVHGDIDQEVPVDQAERLAALAKKGKSDSVELVIVRGVNHRLVPAVTGSTFEYPALIGRQISPEVSAAVTSWLTKTMPERR